METNLRGRLRNTSLPTSNGLLPVFEAVSNSIHSIEEAGLSDQQGRISVRILRENQSQFDFKSGNRRPGPEASGDIIGFEVVDNGIGFNDINMKSFLTLDSDYKADKGGRGVGRLLWLKAFNKVLISSIYKDENEQLQLRTFAFNASSGVANEKIETVPSDSWKYTSVQLDGFGQSYRDAAYKTAKSIANCLLEHCLWYFVRAGGAPHISILDDEQVINLDEVYEQHMVSSAFTENAKIKGRVFDLIHLRLRANLAKTHSVAFCAANRLVKEESLKGKVAGLHGNLRDNNGDFIYACYVSSSFLDDNVRSERTDFDIEEESTQLFSDTEISREDIMGVVITKSAEHLSEYLEENKKKGREHLEDFVSRKAPRYRPILSRIPKEHLDIDPAISDKELDLTLHKQLAEIEGKLLVEGHEIMTPRPSEDYPDYRKRLQEYLKAAEDIKKSDLANYVFHRKVILDLLEKAIQLDKEGNYAREDLIHNLIMPMRNDSNDVHPDNCNLWIVDERLAFHNYLASDKTISSMPITDSIETKEPDLCALNVWDHPVLVSEGQNLPLASLVVCEIKRPMRNDAAEGEDKDPIEQVLGYVDRIRAGKVKTASGRLIPKCENIPAFCYVICDITSTIENRLKIHDVIRTSDGLGCFFYNRTYQSYVEVMSFDRLVNSAKERNRAFFDKLGLPTS